MEKNEKIKVVNNQIVMTNEHYFYNCCTTFDLCRINRMWLKHLDRTVGRDATLSQKTEEYEHWLTMDFDPNEWDKCKIQEITREGGYLLNDVQKVAMYV